MKNISIWKDNITKKEYPKLKEDKEVDVLIIGGGLTGISTLYRLNKSNLKVLLVDQYKIGMSTTANSTGKLTYLQNDLLNKIRTTNNDNTAIKYINSQIDTINKITNIISKEKIECDLKKVKSYLYTNKDNEIDKIKSLEQLLNKNNIKTNKEEINLIDSKYTISVDNTYIFHPIKFLYGLLKNNKYPIYEDTNINKIEYINNNYICYTKSNKIKAKYVVIASHYPYFTIPYLFPLKTNIEKSYLSASIYKTKPISLISYSYPFISIRTHKDYLIYLSNSHTTNKDINDKHNFNELQKKLNDLNIKPEYLWSNTDIMTNDNLPYIGRIKDNLLIGTGYNTWGLTNSFLAGSILSDIITNKDNQYIDLFNPNRINIHTIPNIFTNTYKSIDGYIKDYLTKNKNITYTKINNQKVMIYQNNKVYRKCPHLGCSLIFNEIEKTWDCPCHGSKFNLEGICINGPSNKDITIDKNIN